MRIAWIALALMGASISWAQTPNVNWASKTSPAKESKTENKARESQYPTMDAPFPILVLDSTEKSKHDAEREEKTDAFNAEYLDTQRWMARASKKQVFATRLVVGIAFLDGIVAIFALIFLIKTYQESKRNADAAIRNNVISKETAEKQLRAYVGIKSAGFRVRRLEEGTKILAELCISNAGQTTANHVRLAMHVDIVNTTRGTFPISFREDETYLVHGFEWNAQQATDSYISEGAMNELVSRDKFVILWGEVSYEDVFGEKRRSTFRFRQGMLKQSILTVTGPEMQGEIWGWDVYPCEQGNQAT